MPKIDIVQKWTFDQRQSNNIKWIALCVTLWRLPKANMHNIWALMICTIRVMEQIGARPMFTFKSFHVSKSYVEKDNSKDTAICAFRDLHSDSVWRIFWLVRFHAVPNCVHRSKRAHWLLVIFCCNVQKHFISECFSFSSMRYSWSFPLIFPFSSLFVLCWLFFSRVSWSACCFICPCLEIRVTRWNMQSKSISAAFENDVQIALRIVIQTSEHSSHMNNVKNIRIHVVPAAFDVFSQFCPNLHTTFFVYLDVTANARFNYVTIIYIF